MIYHNVNVNREAAVMTSSQEGRGGERLLRVRRDRYKIEALELRFSGDGGDWH
jgi:hypothetical protein